MAITITEIEHMGFEEIPNGMIIEATFSLVKVYQVEGILIKESESKAFADLCHKSNEFSFGFGNSLNEIYQYLFNEDLVEDENRWLEENKAKPPFLILDVSLNKFFTCKSGYWKKDKDKNVTLTWNCFSEAKESLIMKSSVITPQIISSLSVHLSLLHQPIRFKSILTDICGKTKSGENIRDVFIETSITFFSSKMISLAEIKMKIQDSLNLYSRLDHKVSSFLHLALNENDRLKKFLNFFFVLEIYTHQAFKKIDFRNYVNCVNQIPDRVMVLGEKFFLERQAESKTLSQRFHWCAILIWDNIDDNDIEIFKSIKKVRDKIAHGEDIPENSLPIDMIEKLCLKILYCH